MKGLSETLIIVITAVVILVAALVLITIFSKSLVPITDISQARSICISQAGPICAATQKMPDNWYSEQFNVNGKPSSCQTAASDCKCGMSPDTGVYIIRCGSATGN